MVDWLWHCSVTPLPLLYAWIEWWLPTYLLSDSRNKHVNVIGKKLRFDLNLSGLPFRISVCTKCAPFTSRQSHALLHQKLTIPLCGGAVVSIGSQLDHLALIANVLQVLPSGSSSGHYELPILHNT